MSDRSRISYVPRHDVPPEDEVELLAAIYSFVLRCAEEKKKGGVPGTADDGKEIENAPATARIPR
jgi:hypothetical protein